MKTYELYMDLPKGAKVVATFQAANDAEAFGKAQDAYDALPSRNISVAYRVREQGSVWPIDNPAEGN